MTEISESVIITLCDGLEEDPGINTKQVKINFKRSIETWVVLSEDACRQQACTPHIKVQFLSTDVTKKKTCYMIDRQFGRWI